MRRQQVVQKKKKKKGLRTTRCGAVEIVQSEEGRTRLTTGHAGRVGFRLRSRLGVELLPLRAVSSSSRRVPRPSRAYSAVRGASAQLCLYLLVGGESTHSILSRVIDKHGTGLALGFGRRALLLR